MTDNCIQQRNPTLFRGQSIPLLESENLPELDIIIFFFAFLAFLKAL